jgi:osmotically-inducible protein OsmY
MKTWTYPVAIGALVISAACGRTNNAVGENRPDGAAVSQAAAVTNTTDNKDANPSAAREGGAPAGTAGQTSGSGADLAAGAIADTALTTKLQAKLLADDLVKARGINVQAKDGVITLSGSVMSKRESDKAEQLARETADVKRVINNLQVNSAP